MAINNWRNNFNQLISLYENGIYTKPETITRVRDIFDKNDNTELWNTIPEWVQEEIVNSVKNFDETKDFILIHVGEDEKEKFKNQKLLVKKSLQKMGII